jgi:hypothetical protein
VLDDRFRDTIEGLKRNDSLDERPPKTTPDMPGTWTAAVDEQDRPLHML